MSIEIVIHETLFDSNMSQDGFVFINNALKEFDDMKYEIENFKDKWKFKL